MKICELCENREAEVEVSVPDMGEYKFDVCKTCLFAFHKAAEQSVHLTGGSLRDLQAFSTPQPDTGLKADSTPPASK